MRHLIAVVTAVVVLASSAAAFVVHEITYKGTVISADQKALRITVVDPKTKKRTPMTFEHDKETKILRGDKVVTFADARIQKDETVAVTVDHDLDEQFAIVVRLAERK